MSRDRNGHSSIGLDLNILQECAQYEQQMRQRAAERFILQMRRASSLPKENALCCCYDDDDVHTHVQYTCAHRSVCFASFYHLLHMITDLMHWRFLYLVLCLVRLLSHHKRTAPGFTCKRTETTVFKRTRVRLFVPQQSSFALSHHPKRTRLSEETNSGAVKAD